MVFTVNDKISMKKIDMTSVTNASSFLNSYNVCKTSGVVYSRISQYGYSNIIGSGSSNTGTLTNLKTLIDSYNKVVDKMSEFSTNLVVYLNAVTDYYAAQKNNSSNSSSSSTNYNQQAYLTLDKGGLNTLKRNLDTKVTNINSLLNVTSNVGDVVVNSISEASTYYCSVSEYKAMYSNYETLKTKLTELKSTIVSCNITQYSTINARTAFAGTNVTFTFQFLKMKTAMYNVISSLIKKITKIMNEIKIHCTNLNRLEYKYLNSEGELQGVDDDGNLIENEEELVDESDYSSETNEEDDDEESAASSTESKTDSLDESEEEEETSNTTYTVKKGDTLYDIALEYGVNWQDIYAANKSTIGSNPGLIDVGMNLVIPTASAAAVSSGSSIFDDADDVVSGTPSSSSSENSSSTPSSSSSSDSSKSSDSSSNSSSNSSKSSDSSADSSENTSASTNNSSGGTSSSDFKNIKYQRYYNGQWCNDTISSTEAQNASSMYSALKEEGLNDAQIAGILGNAFIESGFDSTQKTKDTNGVYSYGCFQNNEKGRYSDFVSYCSKNGYSTTSAAAQAKYVAKIMKSDSTFMSVSDSADGAITAAERVRKVYEISSYATEARKKNAGLIYETITN